MKLSARLLCLPFALVGLLALVTACGADESPGDDDADQPTEPAPTAFAVDSTMGKLAAAGKLTVGVKFDQPGFGLKDPVSGQVDGFDVALAREIGKALGLAEDDIEFVEAVSQDRIPFLAEGKVDLVVATMSITAERRAQIEFSRPYFLAGQSILVKRENSTIAKVEDLNGKTVCSVQGSTSEQNLRSKAPQANLQSLTTYAACVDGMKNARYEAVSTDDIILAAFAASDASLKLVGGQFTQEPYGVGLPKGKTDMAQFVNSLIAKWLADGTWDRLYNQYLGKVEGLPKAAEARGRLPATAP